MRKAHRAWVGQGIDPGNLVVVQLVHPIDKKSNDRVDLDVLCFCGHRENLLRGEKVWLQRAVGHDDPPANNQQCK